MSTTTSGYGAVANIVTCTGADKSNNARSEDSGPYDPWSSQVMVLAGRAGDGTPWLWLGCRNCGWFLGYSPQIDPDYLAEAAKGHRDHCPEGEPS